MGDEFFKGIEW